MREEIQKCGTRKDTTGGHSNQKVKTSLNTLWVLAINIKIRSMFSLRWKEQLNNFQAVRHKKISYVGT